MKRQGTLANFFQPSNKRPRYEKENKTIVWKSISRNNLDVRFASIFNPVCSRLYFVKLEDELEYLAGRLARVKVFDKYHNIPRKHAAYGDDGVKYTYSGVTVSAKPWTDTLLLIKSEVERLTASSYNFVLVNRYADGNDRMGFHKDDEKELDLSVPIASLSLGAPRDFVFKYQDPKAGIRNETIVLETGTLLLMEKETNNYWYHGIPKRKKCTEPRLNLTFRRIVNQ